MQSEEDLEDIVFDYNDRPEELLVAAGHLHQQVERMVSADALSDTELEHADEARTALKNLCDELDERRTKMLVAEADIEPVAEALDGVFDLTGDIMSELEEVESTIDRMGHPNPNPYDVAEESGHAAQEFAEDLRRLAAESDDVYDPVEDRYGDSA